MSKVLITGGLGYVGGRITQHLAHTGQFELYISTRKSTGNAGERFKGLPVNAISSSSVFNEDPILPQSFDTVIHLAALNEIESAADPVAATNFNVVASVKLLQKAIKTGVKKFIYFSTAHVYGAPLQGTITEESLARPIHPYAITHKAFEDFVLAARDKKELDGIVVRLSNSYGAPVWPDVDRWTLLVNDLCRQAVSSGTLKLASSGKQLRDFVTLTDVAAAVEHLLNSGREKTGNGLFNLGGNDSSSVLEMASLIADRCHKVLSLDVPVTTPSTGSNDAAALPLVFSSKKLASTGFQWKADKVSEIDNMLIFCRQYFGNSQSTIPQTK